MDPAALFAADLKPPADPKQQFDIRTNDLRLKAGSKAIDAGAVLHNINDSSVNYFGDGANPDYSNKYLKSYFLNPNLQGTLSLTGLLTQSRFLSKFGLPQILADKKGDIHTENDFSYGLRLFARNLVMIDAVCKLNGIELILMSQPSSMEPHDFVSETAFLAYNHEAESTARNHGNRYIDMFSKMGHEKRHFIDQVHYTPEGVERFAEIVSLELAPMVPGFRDAQAACRNTRLTGGAGREEYPRPEGDLAARRAEASDQPSSRRYP